MTLKKTILLSSFVILSMSVFSQSSIPKAQAMFIYNFSRLIEWPGSSSGDFVIGVIGHSNVASELTTYTAGKRAGNQAISVVEFNQPTDITACNILFVGFGRTGKMSEIMSKLSGTGTLIIAEKKGACDEGAAINFVVMQNSLKFEVKPDNATRNGLMVSSKLKEMAIQVY